MPDETRFPSCKRTRYSLDREVLGSIFKQYLETVRAFGGSRQDTDNKVCPSNLAISPFGQDDALMPSPIAGIEARIYYEW